MDLRTLSDEQYDDLLTELKSKSELTDDTLRKYMFPEQQSLNLSGASFTVTDKTCQNMVDIINKNSFVALHLYNLRYVTPFGYQLLFNQFTNLTTLNIGCAKLMDKDSFHTLENLNNLRTVILNGNSFITDDMLVYVLPSWPKLTDLSLRCRNITDKSIVAISEFCLNLEILDIGKCFGLTNSEVLVQLTKRCPRITRLNMCSLKYVTDETMHHIVSNLNLTSLDIIGCKRLTEEGIIRCIPNLKDIEYFRLMECSEKLILELSKYCHKLENIYVPKNADIDEDSICKLLDGCPNLTNIFISQSDNLTNDTLAKILERKDLNELHIDGVIQFMDDMTFEPFVNLDHTLDRLKVLSINERPEVVTDDGVEYIGKACPNLRVFEIKYAEGLSGNGITNISKYFGNLRTLNLKLTNVNNDDVITLTNGCKHIKDIILSDCYNLTPRAIEIAMNGFLKLHKMFISNTFKESPDKYSDKLEKIKESYVVEICVSDNDGMDNAILEYILACCPKLNRLNVSKCKNVNLKEIKFNNNSLFIVN